MKKKDIGSRFNLKPSRRYNQAVNILRELSQAEGFNNACAAFNEVVSEERLNKYLADHGGSSIRMGHKCFYHLNGEKHCPDTWSQSDYSKCILLAPIHDHLDELVKDRKTVSMLAQPYMITFQELKDTIEFCEKYGFEMEINAAQSWHFPGTTLLVEYKRVGDNE